MHDLPITEVSFESIFNLMYKLYEVLVASSYTLWNMLTTEIDSSIVEFFPDLAGITYLELLFGSALLMVLIFAIVKFFTPLL